MLSGSRIFYAQYIRHAPWISIDSNVSRNAIRPRLSNLSGESSGVRHVRCVAIRTLSRPGQVQSRLLSTSKGSSTSIKSNTKQNGSRGGNGRNSKNSSGNNNNSSTRKNHGTQQDQPVRKNAAAARTEARPTAGAKPGTGVEAGAGIGVNPKLVPATKSNQSKKKSKTNSSSTTNLASQTSLVSSIPLASSSVPSTSSSPSSSPSSPSSATHTSLDNSIPDYKHSNTPPAQDLDNLQLLLNGLVSTNSMVAKCAILAEHPHQAPLLAWIYDPLRQFYVRPSHIVKYAQRHAQQRDNANANANASSSTKRSSGNMDVKDSERSSATTDVELWPELSQRQKAQAIARATALGQGYETLSGLLNALSTRAISGYTALDAILLFMGRFCGTTSSTSTSASTSTSTSTFHVEVMTKLLNTPRSRLLLKILDKNLKVGCNVGLIREVYPTLISGFHVALGHSLLRLEDARAIFANTAANGDKKTKDSNGAESAAGKKVEAQGSISSTMAPGWFASRKLDGVRCLIRIDRVSGGIKTLSRNGRGFENLGQIQDALQDLISGRDSSANDGQKYRDRFFKRALGMNRNANDVSSLPEAMILDGEVCVFLTEPVQDTEETTDPGRRNGTVVIGGGAGDEGLGRENFLKAASIVKRGLIEDQGQDEDGKEELKDGLRGFQGSKDQGGAVSPNKKNNSRGESDNGLTTDSEKIMYCVFDCLTDKEFRDRSGTRVFSERILSLSKALDDGQRRHGVRSQGRQDFSAQGLIKVLSQTRIESFKQLEMMVVKGIKRGWEGVMLRKDVAYEGKRSRNLLKIKQFQDAEFIVQEVMLGSMRLPVEGRFEELDNILTNVVVLHRGNRVRVGSGFSADDRIRFGKDPSQILGKTITVQYFEESKTFTGVSGSGVNGESSLSGATATTATTDSIATSAPVQTSEGEDGAVWSLRFPTVKAIYDTGPRQM
ncbi:hypothetical protein BG011_003980 [Mortierella polycephala]|uniref:ATP-dependent DNA ligase family profile domain-containing protein n=1 Tax=Mortierella polycephala TaxID=41804 RepID=A0A9P6U911_9FUNG|nr:hypothetical protein BG011_003980 [Mortierella polycephala]